MEPILEIAALKKYYGKEPNLTRALDGISFQVMPGEFLGIMGSSGSGKSTLLNCIATVIAPTGGAVALHDKCITTLHGKALADYRGKEIGYLFQNFELIDNLTGRENILLPLALHGVSEGESRERLTKLADYLEVTDVLDKFPAQMSGGQKQRIAAARALDYTFPTDSEDSSAVRDTLAAHGLDGAFSDLFEMRIGRVRTSTDYQNTVKFPALQRTIDAMPVSDEQQQLQYMLEAVGYPYLIALSSYNRLLTTAGLPELTLADNEAAVYCDSEVSLASRTALINRLIAEGSSITIDGAPFTLCGQVQSVSVVTDRSITMSFALIVPDAVFDHYTQGDYDVYLDGVLAPSMTEGKSLMNAIADMNALLDPLGLKYESYLQNLGRELFYIVAASYLTIYLAIIFLVVANTIIGVQFLMGQQKAARRYRTLVRLGAEHDTLCRAAKTQINWYFGLPVGVAAVSSLFGVRALFSGILSGSAQSGMAEMMIAAGAMILLLCVVEWLYMAAVKRSSSRYLLGLMAPEREE